MPAKSLAFARMKAALLALVGDIPSGRIAEVGAVAIALNIPPRHVAYILSQLSADERAVVPWHRVVPKDGKFSALAKRTVRQNEQILALTTEGLDIAIPAVS